MGEAHQEDAGLIKQPRVKASEVGVMIAATSKMTIMAWRRKRDMIADEISPNLAKRNETTGISNTTPSINDIVANVSI